MAAAGGTWTKSSGGSKGRQFVPAQRVRLLGLGKLVNSFRTRSKQVAPAQNDSRLEAIRVQAGGSATTFAASIAGLVESPFNGKVVTHTAHQDEAFASVTQGGRNTITMRTDVHDALTEYLKTGIPTRESALAVHAVIHETMHLTDPQWGKFTPRDVVILEAINETRSRRIGKPVLEEAGFSPDLVKHAHKTYKAEVEAMEWYERRTGVNVDTFMRTRSVEDRRTSIRLLIQESVRDVFKKSGSEKIGLADDEMHGYVRDDETTSLWTDKRFRTTLSLGDGVELKKLIDGYRKYSGR